LFVNGKEAGSGNDYAKPKLIDLRPHLVRGENLIAIAAVNDPAHPDDKTTGQANPAGLFFYARIRHKESVKGKETEQVWDFASDKSWICSAEAAEHWNKPEFAANDWKAAVELGEKNMAPWNLGKRLETAIASTALAGEVRASLVNNDPLMTVLGRPNREQVVTTRFSAATTLQALEFTNGRTLTGILERGAERLVRQAPESSRELISGLYQRALSRQPTREELRLAEEVVGSPVKKEGVADLLWAMTMLPEFQLIY